MDKVHMLDRRKRTMAMVMTQKKYHDQEHAISSLTQISLNSFKYAQFIFATQGISSIKFSYTTLVYFQKSTTFRNGRHGRQKPIKATGNILIHCLLCTIPATKHRQSTHCGFSYAVTIYSRTSNMRATSVKQRYWFSIINC